MAVRTDNLNLNLNLNLGAPTSAGGSSAGYGRPRFGTEDTCKLIPTTVPNTIPLPDPYATDWDPEQRAWAFVREFIVDINWGGATPIDFIKADLVANATFPVPGVNAGANMLDPGVLAAQVVGVINSALERADRTMEIFDQMSGPGALNYWLGLLRIDPIQEKNAYLMMLVGRKIGEYVAMGLKDVFKFRRPSQVYPFVMPLIDPPDTPSYPSSHSLQAHLISGLLKKGLAGGATETARALDHIALRIATNREIAGVHYNMDTLAGIHAANLCITQLETLGGTSLYKTLLGANNTTGVKLDLKNHRL